MNTKNNRRKRDSVQKMEQVLIELLQTKELHQISVSVSANGGLNRSTFYANYVDIYELADRLREKLEDEVAALYQNEVMQGFNSNDYLKLFRHIAQNQIFYRTYFKLGYDEKYKITLYDYKLAEMHFKNRFVEYHIAFFKSGDKNNQVVVAKRLQRDARGDGRDPAERISGPGGIFLGIRDRGRADVVVYTPVLLHDTGSSALNFVVLPILGSWTAEIKNGIARKAMP